MSTATHPPPGCSAACWEIPSCVRAGGHQMQPLLPMNHYCSVPHRKMWMGSARQLISPVARSIWCGTSRSSSVCATL